MKNLFVLFLLLFTSSSYAKRRWQLRTSTVLLANNRVNAEIGMGLGKSFYVGAGGSSWVLEDTDQSTNFGMTEFKLRLEYQFSGIFKSGFYLSIIPSLVSFSATKRDEDSDQLLTSSFSSTAILYGLGYKKQWKKLFIDFGAYTGQYNLEDSYTLKSAAGNIESNIEVPSTFTGTAAELNLGWLF